jgi:hypothetical protein
MRRVAARAVEGQVIHSCAFLMNFTELFSRKPAQQQPLAPVREFPGAGEKQTAIEQSPQSDILQLVACA